MASSSSSSSPWSAKLESRLLALADGASRESIQTLAKWIGFNRKHVAAFCSTLNQHLATSNEKRQWLYLQVLHEVFVLEKDNPTKYDRFSEARTALGESVILTALEKSDQATRQKIAPLVKEWEQLDAFGSSPTLIGQMKKALSSSSSSTKVVPPKEAQVAAPPEKEMKNAPATKAVETKKAAEVPKEVPKAKEATTDETKKKETVEEPMKKPKPTDKTTTTKPVTKRDDDKPKPVAEVPKPDQVTERASSISLKPSGSAEEVQFDFEASGIPYAKVEAREFLDPCKSISTLQIARDLRNDTAVQLSSLLSSIPEEIQTFCQEADGSTPEISDEQASKFAAMLGDDVLDIDMEDAAENVKTFMNLVEQQKQARKQLIYLLVKSRCQFGSDEAAKTFFSVDGILENVKERKQVLSDAMDLEGLDFEADKSQEAEGEEVALEPLTWYNEEGEPDAKRAKVE